MTKLTITERGYKDTVLGNVLQLKIFEPGYRQLSWGEVHEAFTDAYPGKWAVQVFPPSNQLVNGKNVYHLFVCATKPRGLNIRDT